MKPIKPKMTRSMLTILIHGTRSAIFPLNTVPRKIRSSYHKSHPKERLPTEHAWYQRRNRRQNKHGVGHIVSASSMPVIGLFPTRLCACVDVHSTALGMDGE